MPLFPSVPEDLEAVGADELQALLDEFKTVGAGIKAELSLPEADRELIAGMKAGEITEALKDAAESKLRVEEHLAGIAEAEGNFVAAVDEGLAALGVEDEPLAAETDPDPEPEPEPEPEPDEPTELAAEAEPEIELEPAPAPRLAIPRGPSSMEPVAPVPVATEAGARMFSTEALKPISVRENTEISNFGEFAEHVVKLAKRRGTPQHVRGGGRERIPMAEAHFSFPEEFVLSDSPKENLEKIRQVSSTFLGEGAELEIFQASGGICAPPTPFYDVPGFASRARPVRAALPSYQATRGGVSIPSVNIVDRSDDGVTIIEESEDAQGGTFSVKACRAVTCATWSDTFVGIISHCLEVGNLNAMTWPEGVALEEDNLMAGWASAAETRLLNRIKLLSVKSHTDHVYNSVHDLIYAVVRAKASIRSVLRAEFDAGFTALIPEWVRELLVADLAAQSGNTDRYVAVSQVEGYLSRLGITVSWYKDSPTTGASQIFGTQADDGLADPAGNSLDNFPLEAQVGLFLNGTFLHLDGGSLELGLVRDSTLNETNDYELFGESFENVARIGPAQAARWLTVELCPSGQFPALATALACA